MKKTEISILLIIIALSCAMSADAQHYIGVKGGAGFGMSRLGKNKAMMPMPEIGLGLGMGALSWKYYSAERFAGGIGADLEVIQKGYADPLPRQYPLMRGDTTSYMETRVNAIQIPIYWQPHVYLFQQRVRVFVDAAVTFSYNFNASYRWMSDGYNGYTFYEQGPIEITRVGYHRFGFGLSGGLGVGYLFGRWEVNMEAKYYFGFSDFVRSPNMSNSDNIPLRSPMDNVMVTGGLYYRLGKGGILAAPSKRAARKMAEREARREVIPIDE